MISSKTPLLQNLILTAVLLVILCACSSTADDQQWDSLPEFTFEPAEQALQPVWQNQAGDDAARVMVFLEPFCRSNTCLNYTGTTLPYLASQPDVQLEVYDYPLSMEGKSFMLSAAGVCVAQSDPSLYLDFLSGAGEISDRYDNNLEIQYLVNDLLGDYDRRCVRSATKDIKANFENKNPLELEEVPATVTGGRLIYGSLSEEQVDSLLQWAKK